MAMGGEAFGLEDLHGSKNGLDSLCINNFINMSEAKGIWDHTIHGTLFETQNMRK